MRRGARPGAGGHRDPGDELVADVEQVTEPPEPMIGLEGISVRFGGIVALGDVSFQANAGEVLGIIGPNGAGKTTLFDVISGIRTPNEGRVHLDGADITNRSSSVAGRAPGSVARFSESRPSVGSPSRTTSSPRSSGAAVAAGSSPT